MKPDFSKIDYKPQPQAADRAGARDEARRSG